MVVDRERGAGLPVIPISGVSAMTTALCTSGLQFEGAVFAGFLPVKGAARKASLVQLAASPLAIVLFESPHPIGTATEAFYDDRDHFRPKSAGK